MSHNAYIRPFGVWNALQVVLHGEFQAIDQTLYKCINGDDGGTWAPATVITIGGAGLTVTGPLTTADATVMGGLTVEGATFCGGDLNVEGTTALGTATCAGLTAASLTTTGNAAIGGTCSVTGAMTCTTTLNVIGAAGVGGALNVAGTLSALGSLSVQAGATVTAGVVAFSGTGRPARPIAVGPSSGGGTFDPRVANVWAFGSTIATQTFAMGTTGIVDGDEIYITLGATGGPNGITVTGTNVGSISMRNNASGDIWSAFLKYSTIFGAWMLVATSARP